MGERPKVLIIEDDPDLRRALTIRLNASGYRALVAEDAICALAVARKQEPDAVVLDLGLPGGDGYTIMEKFRHLATLEAVPIVVLTARDPITDRERSLKAGAVAFFQKPADNDELLAAIAAAVGVSQPPEVSVVSAAAVSSDVPKFSARSVSNDSGARRTAPTRWG